jgi:hypothetical protein
MGYLAAWKVLEEMVTDFRKKGIVVPVKIVDDLKSARTIINVLKADPTYGENLNKIEEYLENIESYLASEGQKRFGRAYVDKWLELRDKAGRSGTDEEEEKPRLITGLPRDQKWIRLSPSKELPLEKLKTLADESNLSYEVQTGGHLLVFGADSRIKNLVKKIAANSKSKARKEH